MEENLGKYCTMLNHKEKAISFCQDCGIFLCNKCQKYHNEIFNSKNHQQNLLDNSKDTSELFINLCQEQNHLCELEYFCKTHNKLICAKCITKIKNKINGIHTDCDISLLEDIENEIKKKLELNIQLIENSTNNFAILIKELKNSSENTNLDKEEIKKQIQNIFTKIRTVLNDREDKLLLEVDNKYNKLKFDEKFIKQIEKSLKKFNIFLEKGKKIEELWSNTKLNTKINDYLNFEKIIKEVNDINEIIKQNQFNEGKINFKSLKLNEILDSIKNFGTLTIDDELFSSNIVFDQKIVKNWLNDKNFISELLFRKSRDGSKTTDFHDKCDNKGITITFIETTKGYIFGGYTELQWDCSSSSKKDNSTFIFSLDKKQKYTAKNNNESIACYSCNGPRFGRTETPDIYFYNNLDRGQSYKCEQNTFLGDQSLANGEESWDVKELEVFKIIYN